MLGTKFDEEAGSGFILGDVRKDRITGRFVKKENITRSITDPQGNIQNIQFTDFSTIRFTFTTDQPNLELENPPRRILEFITSVGDFLENKVTILPIDGACGEWLHALSKAGCTVRPTKFVTGHISISDTVAVRAAFFGTRDVRKEAIAFLKGKKCDPVEVVGDLAFGDETVKFKHTSNGMVTFFSAPSEEMLSAVRRASASLLPGV